MTAYKPNFPFTTSMTVYATTDVNAGGVHKKVAAKTGFQINGSFKTYGGTERTVDGLYSIDDTADVETWFRPDITSSCVIELTGTGQRYEIINEPENIDRRNQFLKFKVRRIKGDV